MPGDRPVGKAVKPLGRKAYGSIPHLPGSRTGPSDHHCHEGQAEICFGKKVRRGDQITVTVKLDGSCVAVFRSDDEIVPLTRAGYRTSDSPYGQHHLFGRWVSQNEDSFRESLKPGERLVGEWLAQAHGTKYDLWHDPFVPFDLMLDDSRRRYTDMLAAARIARLWTPALLSVGPMTIEQAKRAIRQPLHGELDPVEGAVWRVETSGKCDFLAKWVRPDKEDGKYLPDTGETPRPETWNWRPEAEENDAR